MKIKLLIIALALIPEVVFSQQVNFNSQGNWSLNEKELHFGIGAAQFLGDLGGSEGIGKDYSLRDLDIQATGFAGSLGFRQRFNPYFATKTNFCAFQLKGDDKWSEEKSRFDRNSNFRSFCLEIQQRFELIFHSTERFSPIFNLPGNYSKEIRNEQYYIFSGIGLLYFNSKSRYIDGSMISLRPLKTEGQAKMYSPLTFTVPFGVGFRVGIDRMTRLGLEVCYVKTFTDYIDDVSTKYADPANLSSTEAIYFSNPSISDNTAYAPGKKRGDPEHKDAYYQVNLILTRNITYKEIGKQHKKRNFKLGGL